MKSQSKINPESKRTALVTGASGGIGAAVARELLDRGVRVAGTYASNPAGVRQLGGNRPQSVLALHLDLTDPNSQTRAVDEVRSSWGRLDSLVLNAGIWNGGKLARMDPDAWWTVIEANLRSTARIARAAIPLMSGGGSSGIVLVGSTVGMIGFPGDTAYASAKAALVGFARSLAKEVAADGIRVNVVAPGFVDTTMTAAISDESRAKIADSTTMRRFGTAEEIARAVVFLSEDATFCTGAVLPVDGGWSL